VYISKTEVRLQHTTSAARVCTKSLFLCDSITGMQINCPPNVGGRDQYQSVLLHETRATPQVRQGGWRKRHAVPSPPLASSALLALHVYSQAVHFLAHRHRRPRAASGAHRRV